MKPKVFQDYDQETLDHAFDQRAWAPNADEILERRQEQNNLVRARGHYQPNIQYGPGPDERLDVFPADLPLAPVHFHIHGGAWRWRRKEDASFAAPAFTATGTTYIVPDFGALPSVRLPDIVDQLARAVSWVYHNAKDLHTDPDRIFISGHSSGAHLCAVLLALDWAQYDLPENVLKGGLCISGIYDMKPVLLSARREYIDLSEHETFSLSPISTCGAIHCPVSIVYAQNDSPEFIRQSRQFAAILAENGKKAELVMAPGVNHFEIIDCLAQLAGSCQAFAAA
jgi:arylformamidase